MDKTYVFIDESGDSGFKINKGSSPIFVICCVIFQNHFEVEELSAKMDETKRALDKNKRYEFKFNKASKKERIFTLREINSQKFKFRAMVVQKENIYSPNLMGKKEKFYNYFVKTLLSYSQDTIKNAVVTIDGSGDQTFKKELITYLRRSLNNRKERIIYDFKIRDSKNNHPIQLADLVAGSIRYYYSNRPDSKIYLDIIKKHKEDIWVFK